MPHSRESYKPRRARSEDFSHETSEARLRARHSEQCNIPDWCASDCRNQISIVYQRGSATCCETAMTKIEKKDGNSHERFEDFQRSVAGTNAAGGNKWI